jgi:cellulose synthase/poly-beta-1,6-N-acetylglucosamine synthase-like glycosyltransferase
MTDSPQNQVQVTAIVPARNEEAVISICIESLAPQAIINEILVVNDQSTDATPSIVENLTRQIAKLRLLETQQLPSGWIGKNNAVWLGAREAYGDWLLFTDADAVHEPDSTEKALLIASEENAVLVSFSPEQIMETWFEKSLIPYVYSRLGSKFSFSDVNDPHNLAAAANGQFLLIRKDVYQAVGGHASVAGDVLEDVALAKRVKGAGHRIWFGSGKGIVRVRMYRSFAAMWEGWKKNLYPLMGGNTTGIAKEFLRAVLPVLAILIAAGFTWALTESAAAALGILLVSLSLIFVAYYFELKRNQILPGLAWYGIPGRLLFAAVLLASYESHRRGKLAWKGREYPVGTPGASK